jgi:hypothetical protein
MLDFIYAECRIRVLYAECPYAECRGADSLGYFSGLYYKCFTIVMTLACIIKLEKIIIDDPSLS